MHELTECSSDIAQIHKSSYVYSQGHGLIKK